MVAGTVNPFEGQPRVGDFFSPFFTVRFLSPDSTPATHVPDPRVPVETSVTAQGEIVVSQGDTKIQFAEDNRTSQFRSFATRLMVTNQGGGANLCELTLEPPYEDAIRIIDQKLLQWNSIMVIEWGYTSNDAADSIISDKHYFVIQQPKLEMHGSDVVLTITGVDMFAYSTSKREDRRVFPRIFFEYDTDILTAIAAKNNFRLNFSLTTVQSLIRQAKPLTNDEPAVVEQNEKDWVFFSRICEMNNCTFFTIGNTVFIVDQNVAKVQLTSYRLLFYIQPTDPRDVPMITFSTQALPQLFFPATSKKITVTVHNIDTGMDETTVHEPTKMSDQTQLGLRTAAGTDEADGRSIPVAPGITVIPNPAFLPTETGKHFSMPHKHTNRHEYAKRVVRNAEVLANTNAECTIPGVPHIVPQQLVRVDGVSKTFSGVYMVLKVVHRLGVDGYECDLTLIRDASTGDPVVGKGERPVTGGSDPEQAPSGSEGVDPTIAEDPKTGKVGQ